MDLKLTGIRRGVVYGNVALSMANCKKTQVEYTVNAEGDVAEVRINGRVTFAEHEQCRRIPGEPDEFFMRTIERYQEIDDCKK